ncbi:MAG: type II toxin-antitoxin system RelE/ParE family toxin [Anaerolineaceae bacterium]|nr:type II toxin-antitoxin system RelE/ParE family toxin [Anaerolineaceae bacterium]
MRYTIVFGKTAVKSLRRMPKDVVRLVRQKMEQIAEDPFASHPNLTKLKNRDGYRLRVGDWRVIYDIQKDQVIILVLAINVRGEVY